MEPTRIIAIDYFNEYDLGKFLNKYSQCISDEQIHSQKPYTVGSPEIDEKIKKNKKRYSSYSTNTKPRKSSEKKAVKRTISPLKIKSCDLMQMHCNDCQFRHSSQHNAKISEEPIQKMKEKCFGLGQAISDCCYNIKEKVQLSQQDTVDLDQDIIISSQELKEREGLSRNKKGLTEIKEMSEKFHPVKKANTILRKTNRLVLQKKPSVVVSIPSIPSRKTIESSLIHTKTDCITLSRENSNKSFITKQQLSSSLLCKTNSHPIIQPVLKHQHTMVVPIKKLNFDDIDDEVLTDIPPKANWVISPTSTVENISDISVIEIEHQQRQRTNEVKKDGNTRPTTYQLIKPRISETIQLSKISLYHVKPSSNQSNCYSLPPKVHLNLNCDMKEDPDVYISPSI
ncbi:hypothetical protein ENUP19_0319G0007 [Entamoeba nuttalli]|uniref:Uncharacterized protein n=2 Tax=Entamoeba nuttalli TaxID=412467 RepID=K2HVJ1_ENTNP|nr:hypothetical protein ENU1_096580 [Entamoeba nuttalli P19]EKE40260.1 hypothetical protein ENU1_096580 [Entamoeba nuttalli P19]|eukprot:XP_008857405.1 hypothetical protein ENU1_096580 [Entamoeba nuttalli P19]